MNNEYARPLIIGERYIIAYDLGCRITSVIDLQNITSPIIKEMDRPLQLAAVISNLSAIISIRPTTTTASIPSSVVAVHSTSVAAMNFTSLIITPSKPVTKHITTSLIQNRDPTFMPTTSTAMMLNVEDVVIALLIGTFIIAILILLILATIAIIIAISKINK
jgi:hypothetical protein